jgi:hypothetical protein
VAANAGFAVFDVGMPVLCVSTPTLTRLCRVGGKSMPAHLMLFIEKLPPELEPDQPVPDIDYVIDILLHSSHPGMGSANGTRGVKRSAPGPQEGQAQAAYADIFTLRQKMKHSN